jgi:hypothetical protein
VRTACKSEIGCLTSEGLSEDLLLSLSRILALMSSMVSEDIVGVLTRQPTKGST